VSISTFVNYSVSAFADLFNFLVPLHLPLWEIRDWRNNWRFLESKLIGSYLTTRVIRSKWWTKFVQLKSAYFRRVWMKFISRAFFSNTKNQVKTLITLNQFLYEFTPGLGIENWRFISWRTTVRTQWTRNTLAEEWTSRKRKKNDLITIFTDEIG
jgi:hypothetical protein